jgi:N-acetylneuraminic acid mutarotase
MSGIRSDATATLLANGEVLVAGGQGGFGALASAELYDPATNSWSPAASMASARYASTATLLPSGKVLVAGGGSTDGAGAPVASAELYDPATNSWSSAGSMATGRYAPTATLLRNGKVLVAGGGGEGFLNVLASAELYDPATNSWSSAGSMATARQEQTATLLASGKVLVAGGYSGSGTIASAELYDPATNRWSSAGSMATARDEDTATLLPSGKVLVAGGAGATSAIGILSSAELYDPATNSWSPAPSMASARNAHTATLLATGQVLIAGGMMFSTTLAGTELYDPATNSWSSGPSMATARSSHTATLLPSGQVLVAGGAGASGLLASAELYTPSAAVPPPPPAMSIRGRLGTLGGWLKFTVACQGVPGQLCRVQATATAVEKLSSNGTLIGVLASKPHTGLYRNVTVLNGSVGVAAGRSKDVSIGLNSTGQMLRKKFKNVPGNVKITDITAGRAATVRTAKVTFGPDPPKTSLAAAPVTTAAKVRFELRCRGLSGQLCTGSAEVTTFEKVSADGRTVTGLSYQPSGAGKLVTLDVVGWGVRTGNTNLTATLQLNDAGKRLLSKFGKVPATLTITPTYNGYTLTPITARVTFRR